MKYLLGFLVLLAAPVALAEDGLVGEWPKEVPKVTLDVSGVTLGEAIKAIADQAEWGVVISAPKSALEQEITLKLVDRPATEALQVVMEVGELEAKLKGGMLVVKAAGDVKQKSELHIQIKSKMDKKHKKHKKHHKGEELTAVGSDLRVEEGEVVEGDAVAVGGTLTVAGVVEGDAVAVGGSVILEPTAVVEGDASAMGGEVIVAEGAVLEGDRISFGGPVGGVVGTIAGLRDIPRFPGYLLGFFGALVRGIVLLIFGLMLVTFAPQRMQNIGTFLVDRPGKSILGGLAIMLGIFPLCILLAITVIGLPLIPVVLLLLLIVMIMGLTAFCIWLGEKIPLFAQGKTQVRAMLIGLALLVLVDLLPAAGTAIIVIIAFFSAGAVLLTRFGNRAPTPPDIAAEAL